MPMRPAVHISRRLAQESSGQASIYFALLLVLVLGPMMGFAVDFTSLWLHRQAAQTAADAACQAGALDLFAKSNGVTAPNTSFTSFVAGTPNDCAALPGASLCRYAAFNGYAGAGFNASAPSNSVSWSFPSTVSGVTAPSASTAPNPFLSVTVAENVKTWFLALAGRRYVTVGATCTCGLAGTMSLPPVLVLDPIDAGTLSFGGGAIVRMVGGGTRSIQVNSTSPMAVQCSPSGEIDLSQAGPDGTGGVLGVTGGPSTNPTCYGSPYQDLALNPGTSGQWLSPASAMADPFASVPAPSLPALSPTAFNTNAEIVTYGQDGCPDHSPTNYVVTVPHSGCILLEPGYYPLGASFFASDVVLFKPGLYYFSGPLTIGGADDVRPATPCVPACSPYSTTRWQQTDGVVFYFAAGQLIVNGGSGALASSRVDPYPSTGLTCDGSSPAASLGAPSSLNGNVLVSQCAANGTYWDAAGDTTDTRGAPGSRGLLLFQSRFNPAMQTTFSGAGSLSFSGSIYYHDQASPQSTFSLNGGAGTTSYAIGIIVADKVSLSGSGRINLLLAPAATVGSVKPGMFR